jgi:hypothetical protein
MLSDVVFDENIFSLLLNYTRKATQPCRAGPVPFIYSFFKIKELQLYESSYKYMGWLIVVNS